MYKRKILLGMDTNNKACIKLYCWRLGLEDVTGTFTVTFADHRNTFSYQTNLTDLFFIKEEVKSMMFHVYLHSRKKSYLLYRSYL